MKVAAWGGLGGASYGGDLSAMTERMGPKSQAGGHSRQRCNLVEDRVD